MDEMESKYKQEVKVFMQQARSALDEALMAVYHQGYYKGLFTGIGMSLVCALIALLLTQR